MQVVVSHTASLSHVYVERFRKESFNHNLTKSVPCICGEILNENELAELTNVCPMYMWRDSSYTRIDKLKKV